MVVILNLVLSANERGKNKLTCDLLIFKIF